MVLIYGSLVIGDDGHVCMYILLPIYMSSFYKCLLESFSIYFIRWLLKSLNLYITYHVLTHQCLISFPHMLILILSNHSFPLPIFYGEKHFIWWYPICCFVFAFNLFCLNQGLTMQPWLVWNSCRLDWPGAHSDALIPTASVLELKTYFTGSGLLVHVLSCCLYFCVTAKRNHCLSSEPQSHSPLLPHGRGLGSILIYKSTCFELSFVYGVSWVFIWCGIKASLHSSTCDGKTFSFPSNAYSTDCAVRVLSIVARNYQLKINGFIDEFSIFTPVVCILLQTLMNTFCASESMVLPVSFLCSWPIY